MKFFLLIMFVLSALPAWAQKNVAVVKLLRGDVELLTLGKTTKLKVDDWVTEGSVVKTMEKSFVKLVFIDKSQMNIGPGSEMKIEKFSDKDSGVLDLVKGKIRSQVTKDYLQLKDKDKSKLFIKSPNAVLGVRGTDFIVTTNGTNTATVLFEGEIAFNRLDAKGVTNGDKLEDMVDRGVKVYPGEFSVVEPGHMTPTIPAVLSVHQLEKLEKNPEWDTNRSPSNSKDDTKAHVVPPGLSGSQVSNTSDTLKTELSHLAPAVERRSSNPEGFVTADSVKPANGSFVHIDSGLVIPPQPGSILDKNTNTFISAGGNGTVAADGSYVPPKNVEITTSGKIFVGVTDPKTGTVQVKEVPPPSPVMAPTSISNDSASTMTSAPPPPPPPATNDILNKSFVPSGLNDLSNFQRNQSGGITNVNDAAATTGTHTHTTVIAH